MNRPHFVVKILAVYTRLQLLGRACQEKGMIYYEIIKIEEGEEISIALLKVDYKDIDLKGNEYSLNYYLTLAFKKSEGKWGLFYDQNTLFNNK